MTENGIARGQVWREKRRQYNKRTVIVLSAAGSWVWIRSLTDDQGREIFGPRRAIRVDRFPKAFTLENGGLTE